MFFEARKIAFTSLKMPLNWRGEQVSDGEETLEQSRQQDNTAPGAKVRVMKNMDPLIGICTFYLTVSGIGKMGFEARIVRSKEGKPFISFPSRKGKDQDGGEKYFDQVFPMSKDSRAALQALALRALANAEAQEGSKPDGDEVPF